VLSLVPDVVASVPAELVSAVVPASLDVVPGEVLELVAVSSDEDVVASVPGPRSASSPHPARGDRRIAVDTAHQTRCMTVLYQRREKPATQPEPANTPHDDRFVPGPH
jgi:hypothetical protein